eukprot:5303904-Amphidinium_carterae.1
MHSLGVRPLWHCLGKYLRVQNPQILAGSVFGCDEKCSVRQPWIHHQHQPQQPAAAMAKAVETATDADMDPTGETGAAAAEAAMAPADEPAIDADSDLARSDHDADSDMAGPALPPITTLEPP